MINNSLEWSSKRDQYQQKINSLPYNREIRVMLQNIDTMVGDLSKAEVVARRTHNTQPLPELIKVNNAIVTLEQWLMMGEFLR